MTFITSITSNRQSTNTTTGALTVTMPSQVNWCLDDRCNS